VFPQCLSSCLLTQIIRGIVNVRNRSLSNNANVNANANDYANDNDDDDDDNNIALLGIPTGRRQTGWLFANVADDLYSGLWRNKSKQWSERDSTLGPLDRETDTLTTRPRCLRRCDRSGWFDKSSQFIKH